MQTNNITGSSCELPVRLRCSLCGRDATGRGTTQLRVAHTAPGSTGFATGTLCAPCGAAFARKPRLRPGVNMAILAGVVLADAARAHAAIETARRS